MKGDMTTLVQFFASQKAYTVPIYQRSYCWGKDQVEQFFQDVMNVCRGNKEKHFIGTITIQVMREDNRDQFYIIDGQQRLTTVLLLLLAIRNLLAKKRMSTKSSLLQTRIEEDYLFIKNKFDVDHSKLIPLAKDQENYFNLLTKKTPKYKSNLVANYEYFYQQVPKQGIDPNQIYLAVVNNLEVIQVTLEYFENAQQIFESLNSTGLDLTEVDKIKNYLLMNKTLEEQKRLYSTYWDPIERATQHKLEEFFQNFLWVKLNKYIKPTKGKFYSTFKTHIEDSQEEEFLKEMLQYAKLYAQIVIDSSSLPKEVDTVLYRLRFLNQSVCHPFLLKVLDLYSKNGLSNDQLIFIVKTIEVCVFRRLIGSVSKQGFYTFMIRLDSLIYDLEGNYENYDVKLIEILSQQIGTSRIPSNEDFKRDFSNYNFSGSKTLLWYIFHCLENLEDEKSQDLLRECRNQTYSVEHILPQTLNLEWKRGLGENFEEIHKTWLHRLANLTLTGYNAQLSNRPFLEKRDRPFGFKNNGLNLNQWIAQQEKWGEEELKKRDTHLVQQALKFWAWNPVKSKEKDQSLNQLSFTEFSF